MTKDRDFKGYIHDVGGPPADFRLPSCKKHLTKGVCRDSQFLFPTPCKNLTVDHKDYVELLRKLRAVPGVKKVFIPYENKEDLEDVAEEVKEKLEIIPVKKAAEVLERVFGEKK